MFDINISTQKNHLADTLVLFSQKVSLKKGFIQTFVIFVMQIDPIYEILSQKKM